MRIPDVIERFKAYHCKPGNGAWGSLHIVMADYNVRDADVLFCIQWADDIGDQEGKELAQILLQMSKTQRRKLAHIT